MRRPVVYVLNYCLISVLVLQRRTLRLRISPPPQRREGSTTAASPRQRGLLRPSLFQGDGIPDEPRNDATTTTTPDRTAKRIPPQNRPTRAAAITRNNDKKEKKKMNNSSSGSMNQDGDDERRGTISHPAIISGCSDPSNAFYRSLRARRTSAGNVSDVVALPQPNPKRQRQQRRTQRRQPRRLYRYRGMQLMMEHARRIAEDGAGRGNTAQLVPEHWLELLDAPRHRYGTDLLKYYQWWERLGYPTTAVPNRNRTIAHNNQRNHSGSSQNDFFDWLDRNVTLSDDGEQRPRSLPELPDLPRSQLDSKRVRYITDPEETSRYALTIRVDDRGRGIVYDRRGHIVCTACHTNDTYIYVVRDGVMYGHKKLVGSSGRRSDEEEDGDSPSRPDGKGSGRRRPPPPSRPLRFQHSSFFGGRAVTAAGYFATDRRGALRYVDAGSGHYRTAEREFSRALAFLHGAAGVDLRTLHAGVEFLDACFGDFRNKDRWKASSVYCYLHKCANMKLI